MSTIAVTFNPLITYLRPSKAEILFWDNHPHRELHKRFFDDSNLEMACVPINLMILVILNLILRYVRPSEADIEDCGMRKRALPLAQIAQHKKNLRAFFDYIHPYPPTTYKRVYRL